MQESGTIQESELQEIEAADIKACESRELQESGATRVRNCKSHEMQKSEPARVTSSKSQELHESEAAKHKPAPSRVKTCISQMEGEGGEGEGGDRRIIGRMEAVPIFKRHHQHSFITEFHDFAVVQSYYSETERPNLRKGNCTSNATI